MILESGSKPHIIKQDTMENKEASWQQAMNLIDIGNDVTNTVSDTGIYSEKKSECSYQESNLRPSAY